jgi:hypothetical protein
MINHDYKCIFIHIPFTNSNFIDDFFDDGSNLPEEKYLISSQAKEKYADYWDDYFKFSIVRHPYDRINSALNDPEFSKLHINDKNIDYREYFSQYGFTTTREYDHRYYTKEDLPETNTYPFCVYGNILSEKLDKVYKIEQGSINILSDLCQRFEIGLKSVEHDQETNNTKFDIDNFVETNVVYERDFSEYDYEIKEFRCRIPLQR